MLLKILLWLRGRVRHRWQEPGTGGHGHCLPAVFRCICF